MFQKCYRWIVPVAIALSLTTLTTGQSPVRSGNQYKCVPGALGVELVTRAMGTGSSIYQTVLNCELSRSSSGELALLYTLRSPTVENSPRPHSARAFTNAYNLAPGAVAILPNPGGNTQIKVINAGPGGIYLNQKWKQNGVNYVWCASQGVGTNTWWLGSPNVKVSIVARAGGAMGTWRWLP
ncbi:MAG: hypothetical protein ACI9F9_000042 [Candidatus Paceibacteria bacterium]|jgi:hypothetical protein